MTLTVATSEPFVRAWADELEEMLKLDVKFVFANPDDIKRYLGEFFNLARSMKRAQETSKGELSRRATSSSWSSWASTATSTPTTSTSSTSSTGCGNTRSSSARPTSTSSRGATSASCASASTACCTRSTRFPQPVLIAMTSRIKLLARMEIVEKRRPQDGRIKTLAPDGDEVELRISTMPTAFGEKLVMRIFTPEVLVRDYADLGFTPTTTASAGSR